MIFFLVFILINGVGSKFLILKKMLLVFLFVQVYKYNDLFKNNNKLMVIGIYFIGYKYFMLYIVNIYLNWV